MAISLTLALRDQLVILFVLHWICKIHWISVILFIAVFSTFQPKYLSISPNKWIFHLSKDSLFYLEFAMLGILFLDIS